LQAFQVHRFEAWCRLLHERPICSYRRCHIPTTHSSRWSRPKPSRITTASITRSTLTHILDAACRVGDIHRISVLLDRALQPVHLLTLRGLHLRWIQSKDLDITTPDPLIARHLHTPIRIRLANTSVGCLAGGHVKPTLDEFSRFANPDRCAVAHTRAEQVLPRVEGRERCTLWGIPALSKERAGRRGGFSRSHGPDRGIHSSRATRGAHLRAAARRHRPDVPAAAQRGLDAKVRIETRDRK